MRYILLIVWMVFLSGCDPQNNYIDTGISDGKHDCSMYEYFKSDPDNWSFLVQMIQKAELVSLFEGKDPNYSQITFWGPTNYSIRRYILDWEIEGGIEGMSKAFCERILLMHVVKKRMMKEEINFRIPDPSGKLIGATELLTEGGVKLLAYKERDVWAGVVNAGAVILHLHSENSDSKIPLASPYIETVNGVVHSLNGNYTLGDMVTEDDLKEIQKL